MAGPALTEIIESNDDLYRRLVDRARSAKAREEILARVVTAAGHASAFHTGRFADGAIENLVYKIGLELDDTTETSAGLRHRPTDQKRRRVLHVISQVAGIGGHTQMLSKWVCNDANSSHSVIVTSQEGQPVPPKLLEDLKRNGCPIVLYDSEKSIMAKALHLRSFSRENADIVMLHHDGHDVVPILALAPKDTPPTVVLNHADHQFWLGSSIADLCINLRTAAGEHSINRRFIGQNCTLPVPLDVKERLSKGQARRLLGIPDQQPMLLSIARAEKFRPSGCYDFLRTAGKILDADPKAHLYVVGVTRDGMSDNDRSTFHDRIHFMGPIEDPENYRLAADVYLETFPFGSQTALLEAALCGLPVVRAYAPLFPLLVANDDAINDLLPSPESEIAYIERASALVRSPDVRAELGAALRARIVSSHTGAGWLDELAKTYEVLDRLVHAPRQIPITASEASPADISLSLWRVAANGRSSTGKPPESLSALLRHRAFTARQSGHYGLARRYCLRALQCGPLDKASWRQLLVLLIGRQAKSLRHMLGQ